MYLARIEIEPDRFTETNIVGYDKDDIYRKAMDWAMGVMQEARGWGCMHSSAKPNALGIGGTYRLSYVCETAELRLIPKYVD